MAIYPFDQQPCDRPKSMETPQDATQSGTSHFVANDNPQHQVPAPTFTDNGNASTGPQFPTVLSTVFISRTQIDQENASPKPMTRISIQSMLNVDPPAGQTTLSLTSLVSQASHTPGSQPGSSTTATTSQVIATVNANGVGSIGESGAILSNMLANSVAIAAAALVSLGEPASQPPKKGSIIPASTRIEPAQSAFWSVHVDDPETALATLGLQPNVFPQLTIPGKVRQPPMKPKGIPSLSSILYILIAKGGPITTGIAARVLEAYVPDKKFAKQSVRKAFCVNPSVAPTADGRAWRLKNTDEVERERRPGGAKRLKNRSIGPAKRASST